MRNKAILWIVSTIFVLVLSAVVLMQTINQVPADKQDINSSGLAVASTVANQPTTSATPAEFTNDKFHYKFTIPDGWRVYKATADSFDVLYLTNLKETDSSSKILESMITIKAIHDDKVPIHPPLGQTMIATNHLTYETLKTTSGIEMVYSYLAEKKKPLAGHMELKSGTILQEGASANILLIQFPLSSETISDAQARNLLSSFQLLP